MSSDDVRTSAPTAAGTDAAPEAAKPGVDRTQIRYLTPDMCRIHVGNLGALHITVKGEGIWGGLYAAYAFPVAHPNGFISIVQTAEEEDTELGVIRDLDEFPPEDAALIREALHRRYFIHTVTRLRSIQMKYNQLLLAVDTDKGPAEFFMRWAQDRAVDYGQQGKVLIDVNDNRYLIPDVEAMPPKERTDFTRFIYW
jgi:hypothetical protein